MAIDKNTNWRFESSKDSPLVRIHMDGHLYATWTAEGGLSETPLALPPSYRVALSEGAARFRVLGSGGLDAGGIPGVTPVVEKGTEH